MKQQQLQSTGSFITQILYPLERIIDCKTHAYLVGWNLEQFKCMISCVVELRDDQYDCLESALHSSLESIRHLLSTCSNGGSAAPIILGEWIPEIPPNYLPDIRRQEESVWVLLTKSSTDDKLPVLHSIYSLGCLYKTSCSMFQYRSIDTDQLRCLNSSFDQTFQESHINKSKKRVASPFLSVTEVDYVIAQINLSRQLALSISHYLTVQGSISKEPETFYHSQSQSSLLTRVIVSTKRLIQRFLSYLSDRYEKILFLLSFLFCKIFKSAQSLLSIRYGGFHVSHSFAHWLGLRGLDSIDEPNVRKGMSLRDISLTAAFLSDRISLCLHCVPKCAIFSQLWYLPARSKQRVWTDVHSFLFFLRFDLAVGCCVGAAMYLHSEEIVSFLWDEVYRLQSSFIIDSLEWFNHSPGGIKLNSLITNKMGLVLSIIVHKFVAIICWSRSFHVVMIKFVSCMGSLGFTVQLVLAIDVIRLLTLHIAVLHRLLSVFHQLQIRLLYSLWLLFRGQKRNALRQRVDTCQFDSDQFLMGILLFAIVLFFLPSWEAYFYLFAFVQLCVVSVQCAALALAIAIKEFPFYTLLVSVCHPDMLCDGLQVKLITPPKIDSNSQKFGHADIGNDKDPASGGRSRPRLESAIRGSQRSIEQSIEALRNSIQPSKARGFIPSSYGMSGVVKGILKHSSSASQRPSGGSTADERASLLAKKKSSFNRTKRQVRFQTSESEQVTETAEDSGDDNSEVNFEDSDSFADDNSVDPLSPDSSPRAALQLEQRQADSSSSSDSTGDEQSPLLTSDITRDRSANEIDEFFRKKGNFSSLSSRYVKDSSAILAAQSSAGDTVHLALQARPLSFWKLFSGYLTYFSFLRSEDGKMLRRLLNGAFFGRPALDIQLIHALSSIAKKAASDERKLTEWAFSISSPSTSYNTSNSNNNSTINANSSSPRSASRNRISSEEKEPPTTTMDSLMHKGSLNESGKDKLEAIMNLNFWESIRLATADHSKDINDHNNDKPRSNCKKELSKKILHRVILTFAIQLIVVLFALYAFVLHFLPAGFRAFAVFRGSSGSESWFEFPSNRNESAAETVVRLSDSQLGQPSKGVLHLYFI